MERALLYPWLRPTRNLTAPYHAARHRWLHKRDPWPFLQFYPSWHPTRRERNVGRALLYPWLRPTRNLTTRYHAARHRWLHKRDPWPFLSFCPSWHPTRLEGAMMWALLPSW